MIQRPNSRLQAIIEAQLLELDDRSSAGRSRVTAGGRWAPGGHAGPVLPERACPRSQGPCGTRSPSLRLSKLDSFQKDGAWQWLCRARGQAPAQNSLGPETQEPRLLEPGGPGDPLGGSQENWAPLGTTLVPGAGRTL